MNERQPRSRGKASAKGGMQALRACLPGILGDLQARQRRAHGRSGAGSGHFGQEMTLLGRLFYRWQEIVGPALHGQTRPRRLYRGQLTIACKDSAWLHTLTYLKPQIKERLAVLFPEHPITVIRGRIEPLVEVPDGPRPPTWPAWENQTVTPLPGPDLSPTFPRLHICRKKLLARQEGLLAEGWHPCSRCGAVWIKSPGGACAVCRHDGQINRLQRARAILEDVPWAAAEVLMAEVPGLTLVEADLIRQELIEEGRRQVRFLLAEISELPTRKEYLQLRKELLHIVLLDTCQPPDRLLERTWLASPVLERDWVKTLADIRKALYAHPSRE